MKLKYNPYALIVDQTSLCCQACYFCHRALADHPILSQKDPQPIQEPDIYKRIIDQAARVPSINWLSTCGPMGEPLMVPDLVERLRYAKSKNRFRTIFFNSNGQLLDRHDMEALLEVCTDLQFSVDTVRPDTYEKIHTKGNFKRVIDNIKTVCALKKKLKKGAAINIRFTEGEHNQGQWPEFEAFFKGMADKTFRLKVHSFVDVNKHAAGSLGAINCNQAFQTVNFTYRGDITTCCINWHMEPQFGNIMQKSLKQLWENEGFETWRGERMKSICVNCSGLGGFQQHVDTEPSEYELNKAAIIKEKGESFYYSCVEKGETSYKRFRKKLSVIKRKTLSFFDGKK